MRQPTAPDGALDAQSLVSLRATLGSDESFRGILHDFLSSSATLSTQLRSGLAGAPPKEVGRAAHTLKSMARLLGANQLGETCRRVESQTNATPPVVSPDLVRAALAELDATRRAVGSMLP